MNEHVAGDGKRGAVSQGSWEQLTEKVTSGRNSNISSIPMTA